MDNTEIQNLLVQQQKRLDELFVSVERMRKYFLITMWVSILLFVLPLLGLLIAIPMFVNTYTQTIAGLI